VTDRNSRRRQRARQARLPACPLARRPLAAALPGADDLLCGSPPEQQAPERQDGISHDAHPDRASACQKAFCEPAQTQSALAAAKLISAVLTVPAVRPGALWYCQ
jgi:hypothetical protein